MPKVLQTHTYFTLQTLSDINIISCFKQLMKDFPPRGKENNEKREKCIHGPLTEQNSSWDMSIQFLERR